MIRTAAIYAGAAFFEIAGCFGVWLWLRDSKPGWLVLPAIVSLFIFAWLLTLVPSNAAGRAYAAYGGFYIVASLVWLWSIEGLRPDQWDVLGAALCLIGALIIVFGPRYAAP